MVAFFLAGLVVLGGLQSWWLGPLIGCLQAIPLFLGTTVLTAFTDNAALTYLGAQIPNIPSSFQYALVAGAVAGGGLTVIANAPNPAGFAILQRNFGEEGITPPRLFTAALMPTLTAMACLWWLPTL
jgi:Na+/H+ antiporter NhaD/arsenite permease-like protein